MYNHETYILTYTYIVLTQITVELLLHDKFMLKKDTASFHMDSVLTRLQGMVGRAPGDTTDDTCACRPTICLWPVASRTILRSCEALGICLMESTLALPFYHRNTYTLKEQSVIKFYILDTSILHPWKFLI